MRFYQYKGIIHNRNHFLPIFNFSSFTRRDSYSYWFRLGYRYHLTEENPHLKNLLRTLKKTFSSGRSKVHNKVVDEEELTKTYGREKHHHCSLVRFWVQDWV